MDEQITPQATEESATRDWRRHFTTVTPLSKFLAMLLFIMLPFAGFGLGLQYAKDVAAPQPLTDNQTNSKNQNVDEGISSTAEDVLSVRKIDEGNYELRGGSLIDLTIQGPSLYDFPKPLVDELGIDSSGAYGNAVPFGGIMDMYYLALSFINGVCEYTHRIYILDTANNQATLIYEENNETFLEDDWRACKENMRLLGREDDNLIVLYDRIESGGLCEYIAWDRPGDVWYLDVKQPLEGMRPYSIPDEYQARAREELTRCIGREYPNL